jgi:serine/threonine protein kinase
MSAPLPLAEAQVLDGKYELVRELGSGGAGTVYEAENRIVGKRVALKLMNAGIASDPALRARFVDEARAAARIVHANVVDIHDLGVTAEGVPYLVMELLQGQTLVELVAARGALPPSFACELMLQVLAGLGAAHEKGIVHCDLKPANVMITQPSPDRPLVKVLDFGLAQRLAKQEENPKVALGTPMFMAPEQVCGQFVDERTDLYSACAVLYVLLTGADPFTGGGSEKVLEQVARGEHRPILEANPSLPKALAQLVEQGMSRKRNARPASVQELADKLRSFASSTNSIDVIAKRNARSHSMPLVVAPRAVSLFSASNPPVASRVKIDARPRLVTDSLLMSPRLPKAPGSPKLELGRDFMPTLDDPARTVEAEARASDTQSPMRRGALMPALLAMALGFGAGVVIAWTAGLI